MAKILAMDTEIANATIPIAIASAMTSFKYVKAYKFGGGILKINKDYHLKKNK